VRSEFRFVTVAFFFSIAAISPIAAIAVLVQIPLVLIFGSPATRSFRILTTPSARLAHI
jgi:hypothetical protein